MGAGQLPGSGGTVSFKYDPFGRRIQKSSTAGTTNYLHDGANVLEEVDGSGNVLARYVQSAGVDQPLAEVRASTTSYYQADGLGSVTSLSNSSGALANTYTYDSFGKLTASTGTITNPYRYNGRDFDSETGLDYYRARYYDPAIGRFISEDPIRFKGGVNFFAYGLNSPMNWKDPSGLDVTVYLYSGAAGQGHVGIAVNSNQSVGFYPLSDWGIFWGPGLVKPDTRRPVDSITIPTTPEQDGWIQQYLNEHMGLNNGNYSLTSRNCARFVENSLNAGGVSVSNSILPWALMEVHHRYDPRPAVDTSIPLGDGLHYQPDFPMSSNKHRLGREDLRCRKRTTSRSQRAQRLRRHWLLSGGL
jgi:RHS repeat-associated protein